MMISRNHLEEPYYNMNAAPKAAGAAAVFSSLLHTSIYSASASTRHEQNSDGLYPDNQSGEDTTCQMEVSYSRLPKQ